jgi:RimJ/RimL family protein N-acetyltransferase
MAVVLTTPRLILRMPEKGDLDGWAGLDADPVASRFIGGVQTRTQARSGLRMAIGMWEQQGCGLFSVFECQSGRWIGRTGPWIPKGALGTEIGWAISTTAQGKGYATESARAAMDWAFRSLGWTEVIHCIDRDNAASISVARRLGSGWLRSDVEADGKPVEVYGQSRDEWVASTLSPEPVVHLAHRPACHSLGKVDGSVGIS